MGRTIFEACRLLSFIFRVLVWPVRVSVYIVTHPFRVAAVLLLLLLFLLLPAAREFFSVLGLVWFIWLLP